MMTADAGHANGEPGSLEQLSWKLACRPVPVAEKVARSIDVLRYYSWTQIGRRIYKVISTRLRPGQTITAKNGDVSGLKSIPAAEKLAGIVTRLRENHPSHQACQIGNGVFNLLNHKVDLGESGSFDWSTLARQTHLWRFQFHYHEFLLTAVARNQLVDVGHFLERWLDDYRPQVVKKNGDAWHPYCISRRAVTWLWLLYLDAVDGGMRERVLDSLGKQLNWLQANLEKDLGGNHLLENATALALAGCCLDSPFAESWKQTSAAVLESELPRQILTHGEHFERSPVYHCHVLANLLRIESFAGDFPQLAGIVAPWIGSMLNFLASIVHPDGEVPLFGDSVFYESPSVCEIRQHAELNQRKFPTAINEAKGGYQVFRQPGLFLVADFGPVAADLLPAHGHCDALGLELSIDNHRWIVDSGNFNYDDDSMRHYCRGSVAHNVVTVDNENHARIWSRFRMGARPRISNVRNVERNGWEIAGASQNGYQRLGRKFARLQRVVAVNESTVVCFDRLKPSANENSTKSLIGYLHFHPHVKVRLAQLVEGKSALLELDRNGIVRLLSVAASNVDVVSGWYCPQFGKRMPSPVVRYVSAGCRGITGWVLHEKGRGCSIKQVNDSISVHLGSQTTFEWSY